MKKPFFFSLFAVKNVSVFAQDIHYTQFDATPLAVNPAFTGMFDGGIRASALYRNQWASVTVPFVTYGGSFDAPVFSDKNGDYLAVGMQAFKDQAGDGNLSNFCSMVSVSFHKFFWHDSYIKKHRGCDLAIGLQGVYRNKSIDLSRNYFGDAFADSTFIPGVTTNLSGVGRNISAYFINAGLCFSQALGPRFNYVAGISASNINQPNNALERATYKKFGLGTTYTGVFGANWIIKKRLTLRPAILVNSNETLTAVTAGNEFRYGLKGADHVTKRTSVFLGIWYRTGDVATVTGGVEFGRIRIGAGYDYPLVRPTSAANGQGGFELAVRYIAPGKYSVNKRAIPCTRF